MEHDFLITHNDLDATGCILALQYTGLIFDDIFCTDYSNIKQGAIAFIEQAHLCKQHNDVVHLHIADVCFSQNRSVLVNLCEAFDSVTLYDHHLYPSNFFDDLPDNLTVHWSADNSACGCKLVSQTKLFQDIRAFNLENKCSDVQELIDLIDIYDRWQMQNPNFMRAFMFNEYFLELNKGWTPKQIAEYFTEVEYSTCPPNFRTVLQPRLDNIAKVLAKARSDLKLVEIDRLNGYSIINIHEYFNNFLVQEFQALQTMVVGYKDGYYKIRINEGKYSDEELNVLRIKIAGTANIGHSHAFSLKSKEDPDIVLQRIKQAYKEMVQNHI